MDELKNFDKAVIRELCNHYSLDSVGSKRQLLALIEKELTVDQIESFMEDSLESQEKERKEREERDEREKREREERQEREKRELRQLELQVEMERIKSHLADQSNGSSSGSGSSGAQGNFKVKISNYMSAFEVGNDIGMFLTNFERLGTQLEVPTEQWATQLLKLLPADVASVVARMSTDEASNYTKVKENLLARFKLSPEAFRQRFRKASRKPGQPYSELAYYLELNLQEWIDGAGAGESVNSLKELFALEQFYETIPYHLKCWILDRNPKTLREACRLADEYEERRDRQGGGDSGNGKGKQNFKDKRSEKFASSKPTEKVSNGKTQDRKTLGETEKAEEKLKKEMNKPRELICFHCGQKGHYARTCDKPKLLAAYLPEEFHSKAADLLAKYKLAIKVNGKDVSSLRDTGATFDVVAQALVNKDDYTGEEACFRQALDPQPCFLPLAKVKLSGPFGQIETVAAVAKHPPADYIISNQTAELCKEIDSEVFQASVLTRQMTRKLNKQFAQEIESSRIVCKQNSSSTGAPKESVWTTAARGRVGESGRGESAESGPGQFSENEAVTEAAPIVNTETSGNENKDKGFILPKAVWKRGKDFNISREEFIILQETDETLKPLFEKARAKQVYNGNKFIVREGLLTRVWTDKLGREGDQLVLPTQLRQPLIEFAHSNTFGGHLGVKKSKSRFLMEFYYPGFFRDMKELIKTCATCQKVGHGKERTKAPLCRVPLISEPFQRLSVDIVGTLPKTKEGYRYLLTIQCMATRFPDGIPLKELSANTVVDALLQIFSRYGFPRELQTDLGSVFTSNLMKVFTERTGIKQLFSSPYHPETNPVERMHGTLKKIVRCLLEEKGREWVDWLPMIFFAIRQAPNESLGFSPAELVFGRSLRGPLSVIREQWSPKVEVNQTVVAYVINLLQRLYESTELAKKMQESAREKYKSYYDRNAKLRTYNEGSSALVLVPSRPHKLAVKWEGPVKVVKRLSDVNYIVEGLGKRRRQRVVHVNLMKPFFERICHIERTESSDLIENSADMLCPKIKGHDDDFKEWVETTTPLILEEGQKQELKEVLLDFPEVFSNIPGRTTLLLHDIELTNDTPVKVPIYRTNPRIKEIIRKEIDLMRELNLIKPSTSEFGAPLIIVEAEGKDPRACVDYRKLNQATRLPQYPMPNVDEKIDQVANARWISVLDLNRGYWQVGLTERASERASFSCFLGNFQPTVLFFGLAGAPGTFQKLMDEVLRGCEEFTASFLDDIAIYSDSWESHLKHLRVVLERLRQAGLVVKRKKCQWAKEKVLYLGHLIGQGELSPSEVKVDSILKLDIPETKKDIKAFIGMCQYYKRYIPNLSDIASPLTDALKKNAPTQVVWTPEMNNAFQSLKGLLASQPIVHAPDFNSEFVVQTDASSRAISCVLSQRDSGGQDHPIVYLSRKLQPREARWSTIERECLALVWGIEKLKPYLMLTPFVLETDHCPLQFLHSMSSRNSRLLRWSLALQQYQFSVRYRKGKLNANADGLSRLSA